MVMIVPPPPILSSDTISVYYVIDHLLARSPILIFYGPSATPTAALSNSRIQAHIFSPAGFHSYPRLTVAPSSQLYAAVNNLPREEQGDEICRGLAFSLYKYFTEIPQPVKDAWAKLPSAVGRLPAAPTLFSDAHAAMLASKMIKVQNNAEIIRDVRRALSAQSTSWLDMDLILPVGTMRKINANTRDSILPDPSEADLLKARYGQYAPLIELFGESSFLPTSRMKRAPSKATSINSSSAFSRAQKEAIRQEMNELLDTEESFVSKLNDLVYKVAAEFRQKAKRKDPSSQSPDAELLKKLFPPSLDDILVVNSAFLDALRQVVENSENDAIADIERTPDEGTALPSVPTRSDPTGSLALAMILRSWFPKFAECYGDYVKAHSHFSTHVRKFASATGSSFSKRLQETGEQKLMSMLIEPVQRLPRYQLYIDNIVKQLPSRHPALKALLKARDSITQICAETVSNTSPSQVIEHLRSAVTSWPTSVRIQGRLITAVDVVEVPPPYCTDSISSRGVKGIMLLFTDYLVLLRKTKPDALSARGLMAQLDGIDAASQTSSLEFRQALALPTFNMTEIDDGRFLQVTPVSGQSRPSDSERGPGSSRPGSGCGENLVQVLQLQGSYEGKAARFMEELAKARVEGRFSEKERESHAWEVRFTPGPDLNFLIAVQEGADQSRIPDRGKPARIRVSLHGKGLGGDAVEQVNGVDISASVRNTDDGLIQLRVNGNNGTSSVDGLTAAEFLPVFTKRVSNALQYQAQIRNPDLTTTLLLRNQHILQSLSIATPGEKQADAQEQRLAVPNTGSISQRPNSPVKLLTNLFGGGSSISRENPSFRRQNVSGSQLLAEAPRLAPASAPSSRPVSKDSNISQISLVPSHASSLVESRLEETFSSYILSLEARKGNMVGKVIRSRAMADELSVNEVYNSLLQDPSNCEIASQAPVDVLFAAFEKFMKVAWTNGFGPLISNHVQRTLQDYLQTGSDISNNIQNVLFEMDSPSRSAFKAIVRLLSGLLQESANDGDKGILTAAFAEVIAPEGEAVQIITVLDRLVEDTGLLHSSPIESMQATPAGSMNSRHGNLSHAPVIGGHSSSLRKKFGFGSLTRKAKSQMEDTAEAASVWRTLSKSKQGAVANQPQPVPPPSALMRSRSTDIDLRSTKRPNSREKPPPTLGPMAFEEKAQLQLSTIGEHPLASPPPRKKRRSSISDLRSLNASTTNSPAPLPLAEVFSPRQVDQENNKQGSPRTPSRKPSLIPAPSPLSSRLQTGSLRGASPYKQENSPSRIIPRPLGIAKTTPSPSKVNEVTVSTHKSNSRRTETISGRAVTPSSIPTPRPATAGGGLSERPLSGNIRRLPRAPTLQDNGKPAPSVQKLRMQSPKKLRERLAAEQKAIDDADSTLQAEIARIGEHIADSRPLSSGDTSDSSVSGAVKPVANTRMRSALSPSPATALSLQPTPLDLPTIAKHLSHLSQSHSTLLSHLRTRLDGLSNDISTSLMVSESRAQKLDALYRDANAENEALYAKFNEELQRMIGKVKMGGIEAEKEVLRRAKAAEEESESLRRENARLKREVAGLRAQLRE